MTHLTIAEARKITRELLVKHDLELKGWTVVFDNARTRAGQCQFSRKKISLSKPLLAQLTREDSIDTITHEIAHALVGAGHGHDAVWARKHRELGGSGKRCFAHFDETAPWIGTCEHGERFAKYRQPKHLYGWTCRCPQGKSLITWENRKAA